MISFSKRVHIPRHEICGGGVSCIEICVSDIYKIMFCLQIIFPTNCNLWFWFKNQFKYATIVLFQIKVNTPIYYYSILKVL